MHNPPTPKPDSDTAHAVSLLLDLLDRVARGESAIETPPVDGFAPGSDGRRLIDGVRALLERVRRGEEDSRGLTERYDLMMRGADDGLWDWNVLTGEVYFSPRWKAILGHEDHEIANDLDEWRSRIHPDDLPGAMDAIRRHLRGDTPVYQFDHRMRHRDGTYRWVSARGASLRDANGRAYRCAGAHWDITERTLADEQLREREQQYRGIFEATSEGVLIVELVTSRIVEANPAACHMYGYSRDEIIALHAGALIHPTQRAGFPDFLEAARVGGELRRQGMSLRKDGTTFHVEVRGSAFRYQGRPHLLGVLRDITEVVESYQRLEGRVTERTRELTTLLEVSHNVASTLDLDPLLNVILDQLKRVADYAGASISLVEGGMLRQIVRRAPTTDNDGLLGVAVPLNTANDWWGVIAEGGPVIIADVRGDEPLARAYREHALMPLEGSPLGYIRSWMSVPLAFGDRMIGMISLAQSEPDYYTPRHAALAMAIANQAAVAIENARLYRQAQDLAALEERQRLARDLHDSVTQTVFSLGMLTRAARIQHERGAPALGGTLERIDTLSREALAEMRALLFELQPAALAEEGLCPALEKLVAAFQIRTEMSVRCVIESDARLDPFVETAMYRIVQEALSNAVKHARATEADVTVRGVNGRLRVVVTDNGIGFDSPATGLTAENQEHSGMGLRSMRERALAAGIALHIASTPGKGVTITLDAALPSPAPRPT